METGAIRLYSIRTRSLSLDDVSEVIKNLDGITPSCHVWMGGQSLTTFKNWLKTTDIRLDNRRWNILMTPLFVDKREVMMFKLKWA